MNDEIKKAVRKSQAAMQGGYPEQRGIFKSLLLTNPNYFGNLLESPFNPVLPIAGNTFYEELACLGYHPQQQKLEGVVYIYQPSGYGTDICGAGTPEFVRFYISYDNGATWEDVGMTGFQAYNIPQGTEGGKRLEYAVSHSIKPNRKFCKSKLLIRVRAILSWNNPPPANQPNWNPVWGNVRESNILIEPFRFIFPYDIFEISKIKIKPELKEILDLDTPIAVKKQTLGLGELASLYKDKGVPVHRFAHAELMSYALGSSPESAEAFTKKFADFKIEISPKISDLLFPTDGDISYEELKCIGLDPNFPDTLVGVIQVKKSAGYSGDPCTDGSREYVTFWGDFDGNGSFETCLGTADVRVYDVDVPSSGIFYAVRLPIDLSKYRQDCKKGPKVVRIRAILSWNTPVACNTPNKVPTWGNREETLINIAPSSDQSSPGKIAILGGVAVSYINDTTGRTENNSLGEAPKFALNNSLVPLDAPFGGIVTLQGLPVPGYSYKVEVKNLDTAEPATTIVTELELVKGDGTTHKVNANPATLRFDYQALANNVNNLLAIWHTSGDAQWQVKLSVFDGGGIPQGTDTHVIQLDNTYPVASINITSGTGDCGKFPIGSVISGNFVARDINFGSYSLGVEPAVNDPGEAVVTPSSGTVQTAPAPGNPWSLNTTGMQACGYVVRLVVSDRAIVNSQSVGHHVSDSVGFCLEEPTDA